MVEQMIADIASALQNADLHDGDEGNHYRLFDLLDFSGENKSVMITRQLATAAHSVMAGRVAELETEVAKLARAEFVLLRSAGQLVHEKLELTRLLKAVKIFEDEGEGDWDGDIAPRISAALSPHPKARNE